jgi:hypothetical protein
MNKHFSSFVVHAERPNGTRVSFAFKAGGSSVYPMGETTDTEALQAETELYNRLVKVFQGEEVS